MSSVKCERCGVKINCFVPGWFTTSDRTTNYPICHKCCNEWFDDGHRDIWRDFYLADNFELADKFMLDYLGKLD